MLYDRSILPPVLLEDITGLFPIECVLYAIGVKTKLIMQELRDAGAKVRALDDMPIQSGRYDENFKPLTHNVIRPGSALFAFGSDLKQKSELDRHLELLGDSPPAIKVLCVVGRGIWHFSPEGEWHEHVLSCEFDEILHLIAVLLNSYTLIAATRGAPRLAVYLLPE